jgi:integrase
MASISKRGKKYRAVVSRRIDGELQQFSETFQTKSEANVWANELEYRLDHGTDVHGGKITFADYFQEWYVTYKKNTITDKTQSHYERSIQLVSEYFGRVTLENLTEVKYQQFINWYAYGIDERGNKVAKEHYKETVDKVNRHCKSALSKAVKLGKIRFNPAEDVKSVGLIRRNEENTMALDDDQINKLRAVLISHINVDDMQVQAVFNLTSLSLGTRFSETAGMTWDAIDWTNGVVSIKKTWSFINKDFAPTKNVSSDREITVDSYTLKYLKMLRTWQVKNGYVNRNLVFINADSELYSNNTINKSLTRYLAEAGIHIPRFTNHNLRHTHITWLLNHKMAYTYISRRAGHNDISTTLNKYSHVVRSVEQKESKETNRLIEESFKAADKL